jgi:arylsulfatase A-like enzyme
MPTLVRPVRFGFCFDEFFGNLYHLNADEESERPYWPKDDKEYVDNNSPRGVLRCKATDTDDPTVQPHWGRVCKQTIEDTGPLDRKRMETIRLNYGDPIAGQTGRLFLPADVMVGRNITKDIVVSLEAAFRSSTNTRCTISKRLRV